MQKKDNSSYCSFLLVAILIAVWYKMLRSAVEREFEIIGKAMNRIDKIDDEIIWGAIVRYLPILKKEISVLLKLDSIGIDDNNTGLRER